MAGTMVHLFTGARLLESWGLDDEVRLGWDSLARFMNGCMAPDDIMNIPGYERNMKLHTHLRDGIRDDRIMQPDIKALWYRRIQEYADKYIGGPGLEKDIFLYLGYYVHLMTDYYFMTTARQEFFRLALADGSNIHDPSIFKIFSHDTDSVDHYLADKGGVKENSLILTAFEKPVNAEVKDFISAELVESGRVWTLKRYYGPHEEIKAARYLGPDRMRRFIDDTVTHLLAKISVLY
ncbi:MAG: hypothetical protein VZR00_03770 [Lachnospiraceae bacterium]|jgi:hypothetical protein|nr:hypothetical protein [Lachnospiraceae bacterium]MEE3460997.1 hypothetical protein [Lachnospiraceae bacterium]